MVFINSLYFVLVRVLEFGAAINKQTKHNNTWNTGEATRQDSRKYLCENLLGSSGCYVEC